MQKYIIIRNEIWHGYTIVIQWEIHDMNIQYIVIQWRTNNARYTRIHIYDIREQYKAYNDRQYYTMDIQWQTILYNGHTKVNNSVRSSYMSLCNDYYLLNLLIFYATDNDVYNNDNDT